MIYDTTNAQGSKVFEMPAEKELDRVSHIDMDNKEVIQFEYPLRKINDDEVALFSTRYEFISVIHEEGTRYTFRCYGKR